MSLELQRFAAHARLGPAAPGLGVGVYARLLRGRLEGALRELLPRTARVLGAPRVTRVVEDQLARGRCVSPLFRAVGGELAERVAVLAAEDGGWPAHAPALARYEWLRFCVATAARDEGPRLSLDGAHGVAFAASTALERFPFRVHEEACVAGDTRLLLHRAQSGAVQVHVLSEAAHHLLADLARGETLAGAVASMQALHGRDPALCYGCASLVADLVESGALRGRESAPP